MRGRLWRSLAAMAAAALVVLVASVAEARAAVLSFAETGAETTAQVVSCTRYDPIACVYDGVVSSSSTHGSADARLGVSAGQEPIVAAMSGTSVASPGQSTSMGSTNDSAVRPPDVTHASGEIDQSANDLPGVVLSSGCCSSATSIAPTFIGSADVVVVSTSRSRLVSGFESAGLQKTPTSSPGMQYTLPDGTLVRVIEPSGARHRSARRLPTPTAALSARSPGSLCSRNRGTRRLSAWTSFERALTWRSAHDRIVT